MAAPNTDYELLTEHLGYSPVSLLDDIINTVNVLADRALDSVERLLLSIPPQNLGFTAPKAAAAASSDPTTPGPLPADEAAKLEIENGTHQLETVLNAAIDKNFDIFELYIMHNVLTVAPADRPFVRLSHYHGLDFSAPDHSPTPDSVNALRRRLHASQKLHVALEAERARNDALLRRLRGIVGADTGVKPEEGEEAPRSALGFFRNTAGLEQGGGDQPLTTTTEFTLSQLQALRSLSTSLRTILPDLRAPAEADEGSPSANKSWRRERVEYIEGASRKYLETAGGLELGERGEVRDGEWQGEGRGLGRGEVEGLEKVVTILGRSEGEGSGTGGRSGGGESAMDES